MSNRLRLWLLVALLLTLLPVGGAFANRPLTTAASFTLDGVSITISGVGLPASFTAAEPGAAIQIATAASFRPFREVSLTALPLGLLPPSEGLAAATADAASYRTALHQRRMKTGGSEVAAPTLWLFGQQVAGRAYALNLPVAAAGDHSALLAEWVAAAGDRLWILRATVERTNADASPSHFSDLSVMATGLDRPTTVDLSPTTPNIAPQLVPAAPNDPPAAAWWQGYDCDSNFYNGSPSPHGGNAYRLGGVYLGLPACGPRPISHGYVGVLVRFFTGAHGEYEWQCVELVMRYMYLAYGINPYPGNGNRVVQNYPGTLLVKVDNGAPFAAPVAGDVLSLGPSSEAGHTSLVTGSSVNSSGNGTITIIEQNNTAGGQATLAVSNWVVAGNAGTVIGWLHRPAGGATPPPLPTVTPPPTATVPPASCGLSFSDVPTSNIFYNHIMYLACIGIVNGFVGGVFMPNANTTRGQFSKIAVRSFNITRSVPLTPTFSDVPASYVFYPFIETAYAAGIYPDLSAAQCQTLGVATPCFGPNLNVSRDVVAYATKRGRGFADYLPAAATFRDLEPGSFAYTETETLVHLDVLNGANCPTGGGRCFRPGDPIRRGELSKIVKRGMTTPIGENLCTGSGYVCEVAVGLSYVTATVPLTGFLPTRDDGFTAVPLPFTYTFFLTQYPAGAQVWASTNGNLQFGNAPHRNYEGSQIPSAAVLPNNAIYALWTDLDLNFSGGVYYTVTGTAPYRMLVVEWRDVPLWNNVGVVNMEIMLEEGSNRIHLLYGPITINEGAQDATGLLAGVENGDGTEAATYFYADNANAVLAETLSGRQVTLIPTRLEQPDGLPPATK